MSLHRLAPEFVARPWGRSTLNPLYPAPLDGFDEPIGEVWLTSEDCKINRVAADGDAGQSLGSFWAELPTSERGAQFAETERFPLLVKLLFTSEPLSVQVHPGDAYARDEEGEPWGKSEAWHVLSADPNAWVEAGFKPGMTEADVAAAWGKPELAALLNRIPLKRGDTVYVPAGTVHSIGPGLCLVEVQQYSDVTYRVYDYGRGRELHTKKARAVTRLDTTEAGIVPLGSALAPAPVNPINDEAVSLVSSPYFTVEKFTRTGSFESPAARESITIFLVIEGSGTVSDGEGEVRCRPGDCFLATAGSDAVNWRFDGLCEVLRIRPVD